MQSMLANRGASCRMSHCTPPKPGCACGPLRCRVSWNFHGRESQSNLQARIPRSFSCVQSAQRGRVLAAATANSKSNQEETFVEVNLAKPLGVKFKRGNDGAAYVSITDPRLGNTDPRIKPGDRVVAVSASFGGDVWEARNFGQVIYAIKTRNGEVFLRLESRGGNLDVFENLEETEEQRLWKEDRTVGNYSAGTKEVQLRNYDSKKRAEQERKDLFNMALSRFKAQNVEEALIDFENVLSMEPPNFLGDDFSRVTNIARVTQYNIACCYAALGQVDSGLEALESALDSGFEDYAKVRSDKNLEKLRTSPRFKTIIDKYDEPFINEAAISAIKNIFSFGRKK
ncbi:TEF30 [Auxenochlorella protothecoides x Auxenochlorella symbiontica]